MADELGVALNAERDESILRLRVFPTSEGRELLLLSLLLEKGEQRHETFVSGVIPKRVTQARPKGVVLFGHALRVPAGIDAKRILDRVPEEVGGDIDRSLH